jgi:hypothetical protein
MEMRIFFCWDAALEIGALLGFAAVGWWLS